MKKIVSLVALVVIFFMGDLNAQDQLSKSTVKEQAIFAMGCFWCGESEFRDHNTNQPFQGIISIRVGYAGGITPNPTYTNHEGYKEALKIEFDPKIISYAQLLNIFWHNVDPFNDLGQFCDRGYSYTSAIFYFNDEQKKSATAKKSEIQTLLKQPVVTEIKPYTTFYDAEEYHQNFQAKNPTQYKFYRWSCGRDARLKQIWGDKNI